LLSGKRLAKKIAVEAHDKFASDIELLDVKRRCEFANYFLLMSARNRIHLDSLREHLLDLAKKSKVTVFGRDGAAASGWIVIDFGDVIVHLFLPETRRFYDLKSIWGDDTVVDIGLGETPAAQDEPPAKPKRSRKK